MAGAAKPETTALTREIAAILRAEQGRAQKTNTELAEAAGVKASQMGQILRGLKQIDIELLDRVCIFLGIDLVKQVIGPADELTNGRRY